MSFEFQKKINDKDSINAGKILGKEIAEGMGIGLDDGSYNAITAIENVYVELETLTKNAAKNIEKLNKKRQERELKNLKNALELELICEQEYYEELKKFRDENLRQGSDAWYKCTEEIAEYNKRLTDEVEKQYEKILSLRDDLAKKLKGNDEWAESFKVRFLGMGQNGTDMVYNHSKLNDFEKNIRILENYRNQIEALKSLDGVPDGVFADIGKMDVEKGLEAVNTILLADAETRKKFFSGYKTHEDLANSVAGDLLGIFNKKQLEEEGIYLLDGIKEGYLKAQNEKGFVEVLKSGFNDIPESYLTLGEDAGLAFGEGFLGKIPQIMESVRAYFIEAINSMAMEMSAVIKSHSQPSASTVTNTYSTSYNFNASKDTTTQQLKAARDAAALERLRGGN